MRTHVNMHEHVHSSTADVRARSQRPADPRGDDRRAGVPASWEWERRDGTVSLGPAETLAHAQPVRTALQLMAVEHSGVGMIG